MVLRRNEEVSTDNCDSKTFFVLFCGFLLGYFVLEFLSLIQFFSSFLSLFLGTAYRGTQKSLNLRFYGLRGFFYMVCGKRDHWEVIHLENSDYLLLCNFSPFISFSRFATMVREDVNDGEDSEPSVCERNGMIPMHEQSEVIN